jgi:hypothetical protein
MPRPKHTDGNSTSVAGLTEGHTRTSKLQALASRGRATDAGLRSRLQAKARSLGGV